MACELGIVEFRLTVSRIALREYVYIYIYIYIYILPIGPINLAFGPKAPKGPLPLLRIACAQGVFECSQWPVEASQTMETLKNIATQIGQWLESLG